jgi:hypothetical protein
MGMSTIVFKGPSHLVPTRFKVFGHDAGNPSGILVTSGWTNSGMARKVVSGHDSYEFVLLTSGMTIPGTSFNDGTNQIATIIFGATG